MTKLKQEDFYKGFRISYDEKTLEILVKEPDEQHSLLDEWGVQLKQFDKVYVCLSGGIDSQFVLSILRTLQKDVHVFIFSFLWENCVINSSDVVHATRLCQQFNVEYTLMDIDFKEFLHTGESLKVCKQYKAHSPQVALQLKMLDYIPNKEIPIFLGGDLPMLTYNNQTEKAEISGFTNVVYTTNAFCNYGLLNDRIVIKDLFRINPTTTYLGFKQIVDVAKKTKLVVPADITGSGTSQQVRKHVYTNLGATLISPLLKNTGFETLKQHLAIESGVYNQFDLLYRSPLENTLNREGWLDLTKGYSLLVKKSTINLLVNEYEKFCRETPDIKFCKAYNFIL